MTPPHLHIIGADPGGTTGWARFTVPRKSVYEQEPPQILEWEYDELVGPEPVQVLALARIVRETQGLDYKIGPAVVVEDFILDTDVTSKELYSPIRIGAMIRYAAFRNELGDAHVVFQNRSIAKSTYTDERLKKRGLWVEGSDHIRDAIRHALTMLRRARDSAEIRDALWNRV